MNTPEDEEQYMLNRIYQWIERRNQDGFIDSKSFIENLDIVWDMMCDRYESSMLELMKKHTLTELYERGPYNMSSMCREMKAENDKLREERDALNHYIDEIKDQNLAVYSAAHDVVKRWETPLWKDGESTAKYIYKLRDALESQ